MTTGLIRPKAVPTIETAAGIPIDLEINPSGSCTITRGSVEIDQTLQRPTTSMLVIGAKILHRMDRMIYEIVRFDNPIFTIRRLQDDTEHAATLRQLKSYAYIITERPKGTG